MFASDPLYCVVISIFTSMALTLTQSIILFAAGVAGALNNFLLYALRVYHPKKFGLARMMSSLLSFLGTVLVLPFGWEWIFPLNVSVFIVIAYIVITNAQFLVDHGNTQVFRWSRYFYQFPFFCVHSFYKTFCQHGVRFVISLSIGITFVADFTLHSSVAGGVMFMYAAILIVLEPRIAEKNSRLNKNEKLRLVYFASFLGFLMTVAYVIFIFSVVQVKWMVNIESSYFFDSTLFFILGMTLLVSFLSTILSSFLLGLGKSEIM